MPRVAPQVSLLLVLAVAACGGGEDRVSPSGYQPPARQKPVIDNRLPPTGCDGWVGTNLPVICDADLLEQAWRDGTVNEPGGVEIEITGRKVRVGSTKAVTSVTADDGRGDDLEPGNTVTIRGRVSAGSYLYLQGSSIEPRHAAYAQAFFGDLGLEAGGTATIETKLEGGRLVFDYRRPDGQRLEPVRNVHYEGPGTRSAPMRPPDGYADAPSQAALAYLAAISARDGKTICRLMVPALAKTFHSGGLPCWMTAQGRLGYDSEDYSPILESVRPITFGSTSTKASSGVTYTAVPVEVSVRYRENGGRGDLRTSRLRDIVWLREIDGRWYLGKPSATLYAALGGNAPADVLTVPDPLAAEKPHAQR